MHRCELDTLPALSRALRYAFACLQGLDPLTSQPVHSAATPAGPVPAVCMALGPTGPLPKLHGQFDAQVAQLYAFVTCHVQFSMGLVEFMDQCKVKLFHYLS